VIRTGSLPGRIRPALAPAAAAGSGRCGHGRVAVFAGGPRQRDRDLRAGQPAVGPPDPLRERAATARPEPRLLKTPERTRPHRCRRATGQPDGVAAVGPHPEPAPEARAVEPSLRGRDFQEGIRVFWNAALHRR